MDWCLGRSSLRADKSQSRQTGTLIDQIIGGESREAEVFPPDGFLLSPMEVQRMRQEPSRMLFRRSFRRVHRHVHRQSHYQARNLELPVVEGLASLGLSWRRPRDCHALRDKPGALGLQPIAQPTGGLAIVAVVASNCLARVDVYQCEVAQFEARLTFAKALFASASGVARVNS